MEEKELIKSASEAGLGTLISRILGFIRDMAIAARFGAGARADAFYVAFRIPNMLRNLLGEGTFGTSFIPVFSEYLVKEEKEAWELASITFSILLVLLSCLTLIGIAIAPFVVRIIAPGFISNPEKFALTISLTRLMYPFFLFIVLAAFATALLNSLRSFFIPALAPSMLSVGELFSVFVIVPFMGGSVKGLAIGVLLGGAGQLLAQVPQVLKFWPRATGYFKLTFSHPGVNRIWKLMLPATIGVGIYQINIFVDTLCASYLVQGTPTALYYANRLVQLPLAIFGTSVATASLPQMSEYAAKKDMEGLLKVFCSGFRSIFFLLMPSAVGFVLLGRPIIEVLFQRGEFGKFATSLTYSALLFYSFGLISYAGVKVVASAFYSLQDMKTPVVVSTIAILLNTELNLILMRYLEIGGLALATSISSTVNMSLLLLLLKRRLGRLEGKKILEALWLMCFISTIIGIVCMFVARLKINSYFKIATGIPLSILILFIFSSVFKMEESRQLLQILSRRK